MARCRNFFEEFAQGKEMDANSAEAWYAVDPLELLRQKVLSYFDVAIIQPLTLLKKDGLLINKMYKGSMQEAIKAAFPEVYFAKWQLPAEA